MYMTFVIQIIKYFSIFIISGLTSRFGLRGARCDGPMDGGIAALPGTEQVSYREGKTVN